MYPRCLVFSECLFAEILERVLESEWNLLLEDIGLWIPAEFVNKESDDKPENEEELGIRKFFLYLFIYYYFLGGLKTHTVSPSKEDSIWCPQLAELQP